MRLIRSNSTSTRSSRRDRFGVVTRLAFIAALIPAAQLHAQAPRSGGESQQMVQQYQQLAAERTQLKAQIAQMQKDLDAAKSELVAVKKERDALKGHTGETAAAVARANAGKTAAEQASEQSKKQLTELVAKFRETAVTLRQSEAERGVLQKELSERNAAYDQCALANAELYDITNQVLDRYQKVGLFTKAAASEPFTQITRARIDNLVDDYRERAQELRVKARVSKGPEATPPPATPAPARQN